RHVRGRLARCTVRERTVRWNVDVLGPEEVRRSLGRDGTLGRVGDLELSPCGERRAGRVDEVCFDYILLVFLYVIPDAVRKLLALMLALRHQDLVPAGLSSLRTRGRRQIDGVIDRVHDEVMPAHALFD